MFVLDCSVTMAWCFEDEDTNYARNILKRILKETVIVPALWHLEIGNVLLAAERRKRITIDHSNEFLDLLYKLDIQTDHTFPHINEPEFIHLARTECLSAYDATYLLLALREKLPIATLDKQLKSAAMKSGLYID